MTPDVISINAFDSVSPLTKQKMRSFQTLGLLKYFRKLNPSPFKYLKPEKWYPQADPPILYKGESLWKQPFLFAPRHGYIRCLTLLSCSPNISTQNTQKTQLQNSDYKDVWTLVRTVCLFVLPNVSQGFG